MKRRQVAPKEQQSKPQTSFLTREKHGKEIIKILPGVGRNLKDMPIKIKS
jgi:hypothetical protein